MEAAARASVGTEQLAVERRQQENEDVSLSIACQKVVVLDATIKATAPLDEVTSGLDHVKMESGFV